MVDEGLVDLDSPEQSVVLEWIERADPESDLITEDVIRAEYEAFFAWIDHAASCGACSNVECGARDETGVCDLEVEPSSAFVADRDPGDCSDKTMEQLFLETVYVSRGRCYPCHFQSAANRPEGAYPWIVETDNCEASSLSTLRIVLARGYIDANEWQQSTLLTKPLSESDGGVEHGGHDKFTVTGEDPAYDNYRYFLGRYSACTTPAP
jgi:hypothetical protein